MIRDENLFPQFQRLCNTTLFSEAEFRRAKSMVHDPSEPVVSAWAYFVRNRMSRQALGRDFATPVTGRTRRGRNEHASALTSAVDGLSEIHWSETPQPSAQSSPVPTPVPWKNSR